MCLAPKVPAAPAAPSPIPAVAPLERPTGMARADSNYGKAREAGLNALRIGSRSGSL